MANENAHPIYVTVTLEAETCCNCGIAFGMSSEFRSLRLEKRDAFYCPAGHAQHYTGKTEAERLKAQLEAERSRTESLRAETARKERQLSAARGRITRIKNRVAAGVCPCCTRTFSNLTRHMEHMHPDYRTQEVG